MKRLFSALYIVGLWYSGIVAQTDITIGTDALQTDSESETVSYDVIESVRHTLEEYIRTGRLFDIETGQYSVDVEAQFRSLFTDYSHSSVFLDFLKSPVNGDLEDFCSYVRQNPDLALSGLQFFIQDVSAVNMSYNAHSVPPSYNTRIQLTKLVSNGLNDANEAIVFDVAEPRVLSFEMRSFVYDNTYETKIDKIIGEEKPKLEAGGETSLIGNLRYFSHAFNSATLRPGFEDAMSIVKYSGFAGGVMFSRPLTVDKKLKLLAGLYYAQSELVTKANSNINYTVQPGDGNDFNFPVEYQFQTGYNEKFTIRTIEVPLGISWALSKKYRSEFNIEALLVPGFNFRVNGVGSSIDAADNNTENRMSAIICDITLTGVNAPGQFEDDPNRLALWNSIVYGGPPNMDNGVNTEIEFGKTSNLTLALRISPSYSFDLGRDGQLRCILAADFSYGINDLITLESDVPFRSPGDIRGGSAHSLTQFVFDSLKVHSIGGRIGLLYFFKR